MRVIIDGNFLCRCIAVSRSDTELSAGSGKPGQNQDQQLLPGHRHIGKDQIGECDNAGKGREEKDDISFVGTDLPQTAHHGVRNAGSQSAQKPDQRGEEVCICKAGLDYKEAADECANHDKSLFPVEFFFQENPGAENGEKRRHLIENGCIRKCQMINGVKIAENANGSGCGADEQKGECALLRFQAAVFPQQHCKCKQQRHQIAEKTLLDEGEISCQTDKCVHPCKTERGKNNADHSLLPI